MRNTRLDRFLAGTAVALILPVAFALSASAQDASAPAAPVVDSATPAATPAEETKPAASTETAPPAPATAPEATTTSTAEAAPGPDVNAPVAEKLRALNSGKFDRLIGSRGKREDIEKFYAARDFAPLWIDNGALSARGKAAVAYLADVAADGLEPSDYPTPRVEAGADADALAAAELRMTDAVLDFARHAEGGRVHFTRVSADISFDLGLSSPTDVLTKLANAKDAAAALDSFLPQQPGYKALKAALAKARGAPEEKPDVVVIGGGKMLRLGMSDPRVVDLRKRLDITENPTSQEYDDAVADAVRAFQKENGLGTDGVLGPNTLRALNGKHHRSKDPVATIIANLERWRWLPRNLGRTYVMVNIPDFTLRVVRDQKLVWSTKIVVGKPHLKTPLISASMKYITVNPTWNVPPSIIRNEYLPIIQQDPTALERTGLRMEQNRDGTIRIYQPPGARNALGRIRFNFPNKFLVYQHDTPDKHLFARETRAYSHGCMRVQDPIKYGEVLLSLTLPEKGYTENRLRSMFGSSEININFPQPIPVHLTYQTAYVNDAGKLVLRNDIYGWDADVLSWLKGNQRKVADAAIVRPKSTSTNPVMMPDNLVTRDRGGPSFFDRLFGVEREPYEPRRYRRRFGSGPFGFN